MSDLDPGPRHEPEPRDTPDAEPAGESESGAVDTPEPRVLDVSGLVRAVRRRADLSQRELAERARVAKTTVERIEARRVVPTVRGLERLLAVADLALVAVDRQFRLVQPMLDVPGGGLLDGAERRFPAHADVVVLADGGTWWGSKYGLARPPETYHRSRAYRDIQRSYSQWDTRRLANRGRPLTPEQWLRRYPEEG